MQKLIKQYLLELFTLNHSNLADNLIWFSNIGFGLIEEWYEFTETLEDIVDEESVTKEAGDIFAYASLLLAYDSVHCLTASVYNMEELVETTSLALCRATSSFIADENRLLGKLSGNFKRHIREDDELCLDSIVDVLSLVLYAIKSLDITLEDILITNIRKLKDRAERGVMFTGSGDSR